MFALHEKAQLLVDDKVVSDLAKMQGLGVFSTWTLLLESLSKNLLEVSDVEAALEKLGKNKFRLNANQAAEILTAAKIISKKSKSQSKTKRDQ